MSQQGRVSRPMMFVGLAFALSGCATTPDNPDPWEPVNRAIFSFNEVADKAVLEPAAKGYRAVLPGRVRQSIGNFLSNLREPAYAVNSALQGQRVAFGTSVGRLIINTTLGIGGLFDPATTFGYPEVDTRFGETLQTWGVNQGPYVVLPFFGPDTVRGTVGRVPDIFLNPVWYLDPNWPWISQNVGEGLDFRSKNIETIDDLRAGSVDFYATIRSIYLQRLKAQANKGGGADAQNDAIFQGVPGDE